MAQDAELIVRFQNGDEQAFREIVEIHQDRVFRVAYRVIRNREDAWDISQEVFMKLYHKLKGMAPETTLGSWLYRVAVNWSIDVFRKRKRNKETAYLETAETADHSDMRKQLDDKAMVAKFYDALGQLSRTHSQILVLREIEGLDYDDIAKTMGCSVGTVMSRLHYARKKIVKLMGVSEYVF